MSEFDIQMECNAPSECEEDGKEESDELCRALFGNHRTLELDLEGSMTPAAFHSGAQSERCSNLPFHKSTAHGIKVGLNFEFLQECGPVATWFEQGRGASPYPACVSHAWANTTSIEYHQHMYIDTDLVAKTLRIS